MSVNPKLALVVEDDLSQREVLADLLKLERMDVIACDSAEAGELVLGRTGLEFSVLITDVELAARPVVWSLRSSRATASRI